MKKFFLHYVMAILVVFSFLVSSGVSAQTTNLRGQINDQIQAGVKGAGIKGAPRDPQELVVNAIQVFLSILGMVFLVLVLLAGYWYITAKGDEAKVEQAKNTIQSAVIGLAVILMAYTITYFVGRKFSAAVQEGGYTTDADVQALGLCTFNVNGREEREDNNTQEECLRCSFPRTGCVFTPGGRL